MFYDNKRFENLNDRELMELILINQVNMYQILYRGNHLALEKFGVELAEKGIHKDTSYLELLKDADRFLMQYAQLKEIGEI